MGALAIRQIIPPSTGQADDEIGVPGPPWGEWSPQPIDKRPMARANPFRTPIYRRRYIQRGITQWGLIERGAMPAPLVILPVRSSLAQVVKIHLFRNSHYFSWIRPFGMAPGYPTAKVVTLYNKSPNLRARPLPVINARENSRFGVVRSAPSQPRVRSRGTMGSMPRFKKALPVSLTAYEPPVYSTGQGEEDTSF